MFKVIDINAQYYGWKADGKDDFRRLVAENEIECVVISGMDLKLPPTEPFPYMSCFATSNEQVLDACEEIDSGKLVPWCYIDPREPGAAKTAENWIRRGFRGVKMYPPLGFFADDPRVIDVVRVAERFGVPVFLHMGRTAAHPQLRSMYAQPHYLEGLGFACPSAKIIIGHFAAPWSLEAAHIASGFPNMYFDLSTSGLWDLSIIKFVIDNVDQELGVRRLVFGTNNDGSSNLKTARAALEKLAAAGLTSEQLQAIFRDNAAQILEPAHVSAFAQAGNLR